MSRTAEYRVPAGRTEPPVYEESWPRGTPDQSRQNTVSSVNGNSLPTADGVRDVTSLLFSVKAAHPDWVKTLFAPKAPSLVIFASVAAAVTLFLGLVAGLASAQVSGDPSEAYRGSLLAAVALPSALLITILLTVITPYRAFASRSTFVALLSSYAPYALGALAGTWAALWIEKHLPVGYQPLTSHWKLILAVAGPMVWLLVGLLSNHLASMVARRKDYEKGMEELRDSRHRLAMVHEQTRKEIAGLLHGRVQSRLVVLGHWIKICQERLKDGPEDVVENLENANNLLCDIRDHELRSITRQLYPSIIRMGLPSALNSLADRFRSVFEVELEIDEAVAELESPVKPGLEEPVRLALYTGPLQGRRGGSRQCGEAFGSRAGEGERSLAIV